MDEEKKRARLSPRSSALSLGLKAIGMPRLRKRIAVKACRERSVARCPVEALTGQPDRVRTLVPALCSICSHTSQPHSDGEMPGIAAQRENHGGSIKCIYLEVFGGLCNRLRTLVAGICWAEDTSSRLVVSWPYDNMVCYCRFEDLFDVSSLPSFVTVVPCPLGSAPTCNSPAEMERWVTTATADGRSSLRLRSSERFHESDEKRWVSHLRALRPTQEILARVSEVLEHAPEPRIGVLVRLHGHARSTEESPLSAFIEPMREENPAAVFVVATDNDEAEVYLEKEFPGRCVFPARFRERDYHRSREGMKEVLVNFICLARCPRMLASYWSSFGYVAADYGGSELVEIRRSPATSGCRSNHDGKDAGTHGPANPPVPEVGRQTAGSDACVQEQFDVSRAD